MAKKKNLSKEDLEDVSIFESSVGNFKETQQKVRLNDITIRVKCMNEKQKKLKKAIEDKELVISTGAAGVGKTYLSLVTALHVMKTQPKYKRLVLIKSLQTIKGEDVGILPGTLWEKMEPYMYSFTGNLDKIFCSQSITKSLMGQGIINIFPIAYSRGVTFDNSICIIDEAQNMTMDTFKTISSRIGSNAKMIFLGDADQIDLKNKKDSCLSTVVNLFREEEYTGVVEFEEIDSVRNPIIPKILNKLKEAA